MPVFHLIIDFWILPVAELYKGQGGRLLPLVPLLFGHNHHILPVAVPDRFPDGVPLFYIYDEDNVLNEHESPSDNPTKWQYMVEHNVYKLR